MAQILAWDADGERLFETGVDHGVLYVRDPDGTYPLGVAWNGLISVEENPSGGEATPLYADNIKYLNLMSAEDFACTIQAYTYPDEWGVCDGSEQPTPGVSVGQQARSTFGLCFRTLVGDDVEGTEKGYKLHLVWGCTASPSQKSHSTVNDNPDAVNFSWDVSTIPAAVTGYKPTAHMVIDSRLVDSAKLAALELLLYGDTTGPTDPALPTPDEVITAMTP